MTHLFSSWLSNIKSDDIDGGLAADFDGSLSGLGVELGSSTYNMSEALLALPVFKQDGLEQGFQYILGAATSPATKVNEETLTYLNQGQSYEIKLKKLGDLSCVQGRQLQSVVRVVFHERRLQYMEMEQLSTWRQTRPGERILDVDIPLSYGMDIVEVHPQRLNCITFVWDPRKDAGIYIKVHCISTEFTAKKHGGEKGVPFRVQVETSLAPRESEESKLLHCASCQIKVFKPKGAERKHRIDREKMEKKSAADKEKYQPSYECTVLSEIPTDQVKSYLDSLQRQDLYQNPSDQQHSPKKKLEDQATSASVEWKPQSSEWKQSTTSDWKPQPSEWKQLSPVTLFSPAPITTPPSTSTSLELSPLASTEKARWEVQETKPVINTRRASVETDKSPSPVPAPPDKDILSSEDTAQQVALWLQGNRFGNFVHIFQNFSGADLLRLSRDDLIQICGLADGIRLNNALQAKNVRPKLTIYVCQESGEMGRFEQDLASFHIDHVPERSASFPSLDFVKFEGALPEVSGVKTSQGCTTTADGNTSTEPKSDAKASTLPRCASESTLGPSATAYRTSNPLRESTDSIVELVEPNMAYRLKNEQSSDLENSNSLSQPPAEVTFHQGTPTEKTGAGFSIKPQGAEEEGGEGAGAVDPMAYRSPKQQTSTEGTSPPAVAHTGPSRVPSAPIQIKGSSGHRRDSSSSHKKRRPPSTETHPPEPQPSPSEGGATYSGGKKSSTSKRNYLQLDNDNDSRDAVSFSKKQRTRTLELSRKGVYHAVYLERLTLNAFTEKLASLFSIRPLQVLEIHIQGPSQIHILVTNDVVANLPNQSRYTIEAIPDEEKSDCYSLVLKSIG